MDLSLFQKIIDRRAQLQAELTEIDAFLRQAEALANRLQRGSTTNDWPPPGSEQPRSGGEVKITRENPAFQTADGRRWPHADIGSIPRDIVSR